MLREVEVNLLKADSRLALAGRASGNLGPTEARTPEEAVELSQAREWQQQLRQRQAWLAERLIGLAATARKLQTVMRQAQLNADYLLGEADDYADQVDQVADLSQLRALEIQEDERQRLAREIHDGPAQVLANGIFELAYCQRLLEKDPRRLGAELLRLESDLREGLADVRYFIFDLRPGPLTELGLPATIRRYAENYQSRFGIQVQLDLDDDLQRLAAPKELAAFRIVQEALQNVRKHSGASRVLVSVRLEGDAVELVVEDKGSGFEPEAVSAGTIRHFGLLSIQERSRLIRADLHVESQPGKGTRISLRVPIGQNPEI